MQNQIFYQFLTLIVTKNKSVPYNLYFYMLNLFCQICIVANIIAGWIILGGNFSPVKKVPPSVLVSVKCSFQAYFDDDLRLKCS